ncbi:MAG: UvrB/UvrC motif-containing protein, partial [Planctomycetes bacterium]|nr:UvrB/UvrC motif-containing protein [Planctomycetota bacterium]
MAATQDPGITKLREKIAHLPKTPGVYLMKDGEGRVLYVGKAGDLCSRVSSYFQDSADLLNTRGPEIAHMASLVQDIDFLDCETEVDALLSENRLIKDIQPRFNERLKDDKTFPYLEITTGDDFPGVYVTRKPRLKGRRLFGPFTNVTGLRDAVNALQKVFKFRTCELEISADDEKRRFFRPCLLYAIKQCTGPCGDRISKEAYAADVKRLVKLLRSKRSVLLRQMTKEMEQAADRKDYEDAAVLRDRIKAIESLSLSGSPDQDVQPEVFYIDPTVGLEKLQRLLSLAEPPRIVEGIDIATLHGEASVGSLVCFIDGKPFKNGYRRFKIKTVGGVDDYAMIREVIARRYKYAAIAEEL